MGLFDNRLDKTSPFIYVPRNEQEAWIAIMHACIAVDEDVADEELEEVADTLASNKMYKGHDVREYYRTVLLAHAKIGSKQLIDDSVDYISAENCYPLFALTIELLLADGILAEKEKELIGYITSALDLEEEQANSIVQNKLNRHKHNPAG
ncbi:tellurite resistance TerB family protein [Botryobacter ruber]|uniref:TerB family tellurite resistance protein n=1 Tax=Botryobacter ruber TaxID=2171629 RepID=UPI000E0B508D|nr:TerB family tellurite resistance protein [Botryobacter ruber]